MERYGRHYIFQNKWLALILACVMSFSSVFQVAASAAMEISSPDLKIQSGNQELLDEAVVETNKIMSVNFSGGFSGEREENTRYEVLRRKWSLGEYSVFCRRETAWLSHF